MSQPSLRAAVGVAAAGVAAVAYASLVERRWFARRHATVPVLRSTAEGPLRVLHLSDLHLLPRQDDVRAFVRGCMAQRPDLVVATGDLLGHPDAIDEIGEVLALPAGVPGLLVLGSNDYYGPSPKNPLRYLLGPSRPVSAEHRRIDTARLLDELEHAGWTLVDNARTSVDTRAGVVDVAGLGDPHIHHDRPHAVDWSPPAEPVALRLALVHAPYLRALETFARHGFDLVLAGHTHGGQIRLPGIGALVTNCDLPTSRSRGLSRGVPGQDDGAGPWLHVSAGLGTSKYAPVRFACRPEATFLDLVTTVD